MSAAEAAAVAPTSMYARAPLWRRLIGFNVLTGIALGVGGWFLGHFIGTQIEGQSLHYFSKQAGENDAEKDGGPQETGGFGFITKLCGIHRA